MSREVFQTALTPDDDGVPGSWRRAFARRSAQRSTEGPRGSANASADDPWQEPGGDERDDGEPSGSEVHDRARVPATSRRPLITAAGVAALAAAAVAAGVIALPRDSAARQSAVPVAGVTPRSAAAPPSGAGTPTAPVGGGGSAGSTSDGPSPSFVGPSRAAAPVTSWVRADVLPAGRDGADLGRVEVTLTLTNSSPNPLQIGDVTVLGLGTVLIPAGTVEALGTVAPHATVRIPASVIADCTVRVDPVVSVVVGLRPVDLISDVPSRDNPPGQGDEVVVRATTGPAQAVQSVLDPVCPPMQRALAVKITGVRTDDDGSMVVRLVNHGYQSAQIVALAGPDARPAQIVLDPELPLDLSPGESVLARLRISVPACSVPEPAAAAQALSLEARIPWGFTEVTGWPTGAAEQALVNAARRCQERRA